MLFLNNNKQIYFTVIVTEVNSFAPAFESDLFIFYFYTEQICGVYLN